MQKIVQAERASAFLANEPLRSPALTIVVCTYNRCGKLRCALEAIDRTSLRHVNEIELVVVDNNSSDDTGSVIENFARTSSIHLRYVRETRQGLSFARNRGVREARGRIIAFTDDDCIVGSGWSDLILREFIRNPDIVLVGGRVDLHNPADRPVSVRLFDRRVRYAAVGDVFTLIMGCNFAFRRELADRIGLFDPAMGGTNGVIADDIDFIYRAVRDGARVEFIPEIAVRHDHGRREDVEIDQLQAGYVRGRGAFYAKYALRGDRAVLKAAYQEVAVELRRAGRRLTAGKPVGGELVFLWRLLSGALRLARPSAGR